MPHSVQLCRLSKVLDHGTITASPIWGHIDRANISKILRCIVVMGKMQEANEQTSERFSVMMPLRLGTWCSWQATPLRHSLLSHTSSSYSPPRCLFWTSYLPLRWKALEFLILSYSILWMYGIIIPLNITLTSRFLLRLQIFTTTHDHGKVATNHFIANSSSWALNW